MLLRSMGHTCKHMEQHRAFECFGICKCPVTILWACAVLTQVFLPGEIKFVIKFIIKLMFVFQKKFKCQSGPPDFQPNRDLAKSICAGMGSSKVFWVFCSRLQNHFSVVTSFTSLMLPDQFICSSLSGKSSMFSPFLLKEHTACMYQFQKEQLL